ncbi:MAG TPA: PHP domain-containing protein [Ktedonobacteraceae bacterium]|nr:PHP domain-containing protein [Ktedonobacteraceae bacterium]
MVLDSDFHSHVSRSSALQMARSAHAKGLRVLGISEHIFQMHEAHPLLDHMPQEGPMMALADYIEAVRSAGQQARCDVRLGMEVDFIPQQNEQIQTILQGHDWDFLIGSVHEVDGLQYENDLHVKREEGEALWQRYFELLRQAASSGYFSLVSHPVRMRARNPFLPPNIDEELERLAAEATRHDVALEINGFDILTYPGLVQRLARACAAQQTPICVGSDAHDPRQIARAHAETETLLQAVGIRKIRIWKQRLPEEYII